MLFSSSFVWCSRVSYSVLLVPSAEMEGTSMASCCHWATFGGTWTKPLGLCVLMALCRGQEVVGLCCCCCCQQIGLPAGTPVVEPGLGWPARTLLLELLIDWSTHWVWVMKLGLGSPSLHCELCCSKSDCPGMPWILRRAGMESVFAATTATSGLGRQQQPGDESVLGLSAGLCWTYAF